MLCSCVAEDLSQCNSEASKPKQPSGITKTFYANIMLDMVGGVPYTRAEGEVEGGYGFDQDYVDGSDDESNISNVLIIFYDKDGNYLTHFSSDDELSKESTTEETPWVEKIKWKTSLEIGVDVDEAYAEDEAAFASFFTIVNYGDALYKNTDGTLSGSLVSTVAGKTGELKSLQDIQSILSQETTVSTTTYPAYKSPKGFIMTTPGKYKDNGDGSYTYINYQEIPDGTISITKPSEVYELNTLTVYVERLAARVDVEVVDNIYDIEVLYQTVIEGTDSYTNDVYTLTFVPDTWGMEALEKTEYLWKKQTVTPTEFDGYDTYHSDFFDWINYEGKRTFWAESPTFRNGGYAAKGDGTETVSLAYYSFANLKNTLSTKTDNSNGVSSKIGSVYISEHTFQKDELDAADNPYAVPTSFVLTGEYAVKYKATDEVETGTKSVGDVLDLNGAGFYIRYIDMERTDKDAVDNDGNAANKRYQYRLYRENNGNSEQDKQNDLYTAFLKEQYTVFVKSVSIHYYTDDYGNSLSETFEEYIPVKAQTTFSQVEGGQNVEYSFNAYDIFEIRNTKKLWLDPSWVGASNTYTLQLKKLTASVLKNDTETVNNYNLPLFAGSYSYGDNTGYYEPIVNIVDEDAPGAESVSLDVTNEMLQQQLGYAQLFFKGKAFFYAPVTHYTGEGNPFPVATNPFTGSFKYLTQNVNGIPTYVKDAATGKYKLNHKTADFAVVRNNIYNFKINGITSLGFGIPSLDAIPLPEPRLNNDIYQFDIELKILPWNVFEYYLDI